MRDDILDDVPMICGNCIFFSEYDEWCVYHKLDTETYDYCQIFVYDV